MDYSCFMFFFPHSYGDFAPRTQNGRLLAIFFIPLSVGAMGHFLSSVASVIMDSRRSNFQRQMDQHELSMQDLEIMDDDGDGLVTRAEYLEFMLIAMNKVDKDFIDEIRSSFARLDVDGTGVLSKADMVATAVEPASSLVVPRRSGQPQPKTTKGR